MKKKWEREELIALVRDHPVKMFFICPLGIGIDDIRWNELWLGIAQLAESIGCLVLVVLLLIWQRIIRDGLLRPFYKAHLIMKYRKAVLEREKNHDRK